MANFRYPEFEEAVSQQFQDLLGFDGKRLRVEQGRRAKDHGVDLIFHKGNQTFFVECKSSGDAASVSMAARQLKSYMQQAKRKGIPVVAVSYMGEVGQGICEKEGVSWIDLSGNGHLWAPPAVFIHVEGKPNRFKRKGRPGSVFATKSARIARWLLIKRKHAFTQRELAKVSGLDEGFTSRIVRELENRGLVSRDAKGAVQVADFNAMLEAWREVYDFSKHHVARGHIAARSSEDVLRQLAGQFQRSGIEHAATGLAGAWLLNPFAGFRLVAFYVRAMPPDEVRRALGFREEERGENVWLVIPNDEGVFDGASEHDGIRCVHPVQAYLDLKNHPERSAEAAEELRKKFLRAGDA
jgi:hypothetical protein